LDHAERPQDPLWQRSLQRPNGILLSRNANV
jgi:hypothetical protein